MVFIGVRKNIEKWNLLEDAVLFGFCQHITCIKQHTAISC